MCKKEIASLQGRLEEILQTTVNSQEILMSFLFSWRFTLSRRKMGEFRYLLSDVLCFEQGFGLAGLGKPKLRTATNPII